MFFPNQFFCETDCIADRFELGAFGFCELVLEACEEILFITRRHRYRFRCKLASTGHVFADELPCGRAVARNKPCSVESLSYFAADLMTVCARISRAGILAYLAPDIGFLQHFCLIAMGKLLKSEAQAAAIVHTLGGDCTCRTGVRTFCTAAARRIPFIVFERIERVNCECKNNAARTVPLYRNERASALVAYSAQNQLLFYGYICFFRTNSTICQFFDKFFDAEICFIGSEIVCRDTFVYIESRIRENEHRNALCERELRLCIPNESERIVIIAF